MDWTNHYRSKLTGPEEAVAVVKSGDLVCIPAPPHPNALIQSLASRAGTLENVEVRIDSPTIDPGWMLPSWQNSFSLIAEQFLGTSRDAHDARYIDYSPILNSVKLDALVRSGNPQPIDVLMILVSSPDQNGYCSFGYGLWDKAKLIHLSKAVLAQVDSNQIRTHGNNYIHVTELDRMVECTTPIFSISETDEVINSIKNKSVKSCLQSIVKMMSPNEVSRYLPDLINLSSDQINDFGARKGWLSPPQKALRIAEAIGELVKDESTLQLGIGTPSSFMPALGAFDSKRNLGWHSELTVPGSINLIQRGIVTGTHKTLNPGKAVFTSLHGSNKSEIEFTIDNPAIELQHSDVVVNAVNIAKHDKMIAINNAISIDLTGQINAESVFGGRQISGTGGQLDFQIGAITSKGGRAITLLWSTALNGSVSRIVPQLEHGSIITVPRTFADTVITEYGIACLLGKSIRDRAQELINIAHPDFRSDLTNVAKRLFYP